MTAKYSSDGPIVMLENPGLPPLRIAYAATPSGRATSLTH